MTADTDTRIAEWSRADAPEGSLARAMWEAYASEMLGPQFRDWSSLIVTTRELYARMAVAAIDAYIARNRKIIQETVNRLGGRLDD